LTNGIGNFEGSGELDNHNFHVMIRDKSLTGGAQKRTGEEKVEIGVLFYRRSEK
jgi:hypothetical protein